MTIKQRLMLSNILMLILPIVLMTIFGFILIVTLIGVFGFNFYDFLRDGDIFSHAVLYTKNASEAWADYDLEQLTLEIDARHSLYRNENLSFAVYRDGETVHSIGNFSGNPVLEIALNEPSGGYYSMNSFYFYVETAGDYKIVVMDANHKFYNRFFISDKRKNFIILQAFLFFAMIAVFMTTNRLLARMIIKRIAEPLNILSMGVRQISNGNLDYRIKYTGRDEFTAVCDDFNDMALRLADIVNARQQDAQTRKELIAGISHDLRTPLTAIKTYVEGIELGLASTPQIQSRYLKTIKNKTKDLEHIVNQLFMFSKLDIGEFPIQKERIDIGRWLADYLSGIAEEYNQRGLQIILAENAPNATVVIDGVQLRSVITNILENSLTHGRSGHGTVSVTCRAADAEVMITLTDDGPGVPEDVLDKLFDIFFRGDKARSNTGQGSGLGLAISAKITERMGGTIKASNISGGGLAITITLPAHFA